jgi:hypothetical protein
LTERASRKEAQICYYSLFIWNYYRQPQRISAAHGGEACDGARCNIRTRFDPAHHRKGSRQPKFGKTKALDCLTNKKAQTTGDDSVLNTG